MTPAQFEGIIAGYALSFSSVRDPAVEQARLPSMVRLYWHLADAQNAPPRQIEFAEALADCMPHLPRGGVLARAQRTYSSVVRQHHFWLMLQERFPYAYQSPRLDMDGFDFLILEDGRAYGIGLSTATDAALEWQAIKRRRHVAPPIPVLDLYVDRDTCREVGRFWLHPSSDIEQIEAWIDREKTRQFDEAAPLLDEVYRQSERRPRCSRADYASGFFGALAYLKQAVRGGA